MVSIWLNKIRTIFKQKQKKKVSSITAQGTSQYLPVLPYEGWGGVKGGEVGGFPEAGTLNFMPYVTPSERLPAKKRTNRISMTTKTLNNSINWNFESVISFQLFKMNIYFVPQGTCSCLNTFILTNLN